MARKPKPKVKARKPKVTVRKVKLDHGSIIHVEVPKGVVPVVATKPDVIQIVPVRHEEVHVEVHKSTWWERLLGLED